MPRKNSTIPHKKYEQNPTCAKKRRYATEREALDIAGYQMLLKPSVELGVYHCVYCNHWHLTNIGKK